jgi:type II secretory pathway pseudopilin PulG
MTVRKCRIAFLGFSLVEVVLAIGVVSFSVLATIGLLSVASDTSKRAKDEGSAARLAANEFERLGSLSSADSFWTTRPLAYATRYYDSNLTDLGTDRPMALTKGAVYQFQISFIEAPTPGNPTASPTPPAGTADVVMNAEVRYPVQAATANQNVFRFTALMNNPN